MMMGVLSWIIAILLALPPGIIVGNIWVGDLGTPS